MTIERYWWVMPACVVSFLSTACSRQPPAVAHAAEPGPAVSGTVEKREVRVTGIVQAVKYTTILVPTITDQGGGRLTLTKLAANGSRVKAGDIVAEFDRTQQLDNARDAGAKFEDLGHQVEQRRAQNRADAEKRLSDLEKAEADLAKAQIQLKKGPLLSEIDRLKAEVRAGDAQARVESLKKSNAAHDRADAAALRTLELQRDRQKVSLERSLNNAAKLEIHAPMAGMVALDNVWRNNSIGHPQEGDQLWRGQPLLHLFDPAEMEVQVQVGEPDGAALAPGCRAVVRLDSYPEVAFPARFESASPVAASAIGSPIKTFSARFRIETVDPHLLPDLSAAVIVQPPPVASGPGVQAR